MSHNTSSILSTELYRISVLSRFAWHDSIFTNEPWGDAYAENLVMSRRQQVVQHQRYPFCFIGITVPQARHTIDDFLPCNMHTFSTDLCYSKRTARLVQRYCGYSAVMVCRQRFLMILWSGCTDRNVRNDEMRLWRWAWCMCLMITSHEAQWIPTLSVRIFIPFFLFCFLSVSSNTTINFFRPQYGSWGRRYP